FAYPGFWRGYYEAIVPEQLTCELDFGQIRKVLVHLVRNAVEAMKNGGNLTIEVAAKSEQIHIYVRDTGTGIEGSELEKATDPFYTTKKSGTGVGLALVERIINDHQGELIIRNRKSGGTEVVIALPQ
ncbi:MAG: GHKL domain-containing protein, partial [Candidatus Electrothrix sp. ATG2]|nr:GHKL domain-containing protein [Candidatus Electrothrix sp. ATG2]